MPGLFLSAIEYGGYISIIKFLVFLVLFFLWLPLVGWVCEDARTVGAKDTLWTAVVFGAGAVAAIVWLLMPLFIIGMLFFIIAVIATSMSYVIHRNAKVPHFDRVLTPEHIKGLFENQQKKIDALSELIFITPNNNEIPVPEPRTPEFFGYKTAFDIFTDAMWRRASDIMFAPTPQEYNVAYYIDGAALKQPSIPRDQMEYFIRFVKNLANLDPDEKRKPQRGKFRIHKQKENYDWEITTAGSTAGEQISLKHMTEQAITRLADINLTPDQYGQMNKIRGAKQGLLIISGPRKTGVTSTFYSLLRNHDAFLAGISTLERQPSLNLPNITQNTYTLSDTGTTTYAKKLQQVVRMEPDVVGIADCNDTETAQIACAAAKDGKLIYLTLEADNVIKALGKWVKLVANKSLAVEPLLGISNQRLLRKLCNECKQAYEPNKELLRKFNIPAEKAKVLYRAGKVVYDKRGKPSTCENCQGTGFFGRMCVFEMIILNGQLRNLIMQAKSLSEISTQFRRAKMLYLQEQALRKVIDGTTSVNEMVRILSTPKRQKARRPEQKA
ncbi:MAG: Flp pilus assembly complex ATPase component TadA [Planctomycetota bacterium]|nr:MAG: Flp pilus assembly complex ATPase component TadA [Planctomycetota bacterium]